MTIEELKTDIQEYFDILQLDAGKLYYEMNDFKRKAHSWFKEISQMKSQEAKNICKDFEDKCDPNILYAVNYDEAILICNKLLDILK